MSLTLAVFRIAAAALPSLPAPLVGVLAGLAGWCAWLVNTAGRRCVRANLRVVLDREPSRAAVRAVFVTAAQNYFDLFHPPRLSTATSFDRVDVEGWENLVEALRAGRGALLASLHLGNIEVLGRAAAGRGIEVMLPVERLEPPELLELMLELRRRAGFVCEPVGRNAIGRVREALRRGAVVGIGADRITLGNGALVAFCGRPARMPVAAAILALRTGAPLLPYASQRLPGHRFRVRIGAAIPVTRAGDLRADAREITERLLADLAGYLRDNPTQWVVFRRVWEPECPA